MAQFNANEIDTRKSIAFQGVSASDVVGLNTAIDLGYNMLSGLSLAGNKLSAATETRARQWSGDTATLTTGVMYLGFVTAEFSKAMTKMRFYTAGTAGVTVTLVRMGVYTVGTAGLCTLIASTPTDTTLGVAANTMYEKALSVGYTQVIGQRYALGILYSATTMPVIYGDVQNPLTVGDSPRISGAITVADLSTPTVADAALTVVTGFCPYLQVL